GGLHGVGLWQLGEREAVPVDRHRPPERRQGRAWRAPGDGDPAEELKVPQRPAQLRVDVDDDAITSWGRERHDGAELTARLRLRMLVDDRAEVTAHDDQVNAGMGTAAGAVAGQRRAGGLIDPKRDPLWLACGRVAAADVRH